MITVFSAEQVPYDNIYLFGAGSRALEFLDTQRHRKKKFNIIGVIDTYKAGMTFKNYLILNITDLQSFDPASQCIIICSHKHNEILSTLHTHNIKKQIYIYKAGHYKILTQILLRLLNGNKINIVDGGSRGLASLDLQPEYELLPSNMLNVVAFEPDAEEASKLSKTLENTFNRISVYPVGLWSHPGSADFYLTQPPENSSCFMPNETFIRSLRNAWNTNTLLAASFCLDRKLSIEVTSLDHLHLEGEIPLPDFIKLDIHGSELEALKGSQNLIHNVLGIRVEVWFAELYYGIPLFADIDQFLRSCGFRLFSLPTSYGQGRSIYSHNISMMYRADGIWPGEITVSDALYFRDPTLSLMTAEEINALWPVDKVIKLAILADVNNQTDYAFAVLDWYIRATRHGYQREMLVEAFNDAMGILLEAYPPASL